MISRLNSKLVNNLNLRKDETKDEKAEKDVKNTNNFVQPKSKKITTNLSDYLNSMQKIEKFEEVFAEFDKNVPDITTTIEEKELAIKYIDKMLACDDIPNDLKAYWSDKKIIIQAEIQNIKNEQQIGKDNKYDDVLKELNQFVKNYRNNAPNNFKSLEDRVEYWITYNNTCISFYERMLASKNITDEQKNYCLDQIQCHKRDINYQKIDLNNARKDRSVKTESYKDVFNEMRNVVPDRTTTVAQKELAMSYINRMLSCDDMPNDLKTYWSEKLNVLKDEISKF